MAATRTSYTILPHAIANMAATRTGLTVSCSVLTWPPLEPVLQQYGCHKNPPRENMAAKPVFSGLPPQELVQPALARAYITDTGPDSTVH
jgi:hypothetical protein